VEGRETGKWEGGKGGERGKSGVPFPRVQWRRNQGFRRFNEPEARAPEGPERGDKKIRQENNRPAVAL